MIVLQEGLVIDSVFIIFIELTKIGDSCESRGQGCD